MDDKLLASIFEGYTCGELDTEYERPGRAEEARPSQYLRSRSADGTFRYKHGKVRFKSNAATPSQAEAEENGSSSRKNGGRIPDPPSILRSASSLAVDLADDVVAPKSPRALQAEAEAHARAMQNAVYAHRNSNAWISSTTLAETPKDEKDLDFSLGGPAIPLKHIRRDSDMSSRTGADDYDEMDTDEDEAAQEHLYPVQTRSATNLRTAAREGPMQVAATSNSSERAKPSEVFDGSVDGIYTVPPPQHYRGGVLSEMLKLYKGPKVSHHKSRSNSNEDGSSSRHSRSGSATPNRRKWYEQNRSQETLANLVGASAKLADFTNNKHADDLEPGRKTNSNKRPKHTRRASSSRLSALWHREEAQIRTQIVDTLSRRELIVKLCHALMLYGAPTHRLEEYLTTVAQALEIEGKFLYMPGCMLVSFDDSTTHTTEVQLVRLAQGINLGKLKEVHHIYKEIMHNIITPNEAIEQLEELSTRRDQFHPWIRVLVFGLTSVAASPFSFKARLIDLPLLFCFGCIVGVLQLIVAPRSPLYSNVFEVSATVLISFLARAFGSISGGNLFCFSALAQGGIVMLLPGYMVLSSSLELQSRAIIPGSLRIVYALIYSLLLGYGITVGAALYGLIDSNATHSTTCSATMNPYYTFIFVPFFVACISILYQARWHQMPSMIIIACAGYIVNYFSSIRFVASPQIASTLGALAVGVMANTYSRVRHSVAAATLIPAIFTQVPGGLASNGGLLSGLQTAEMIANHTSNSTSSDITGMGMESLHNVVFNMGASMIQIAIGITVGLFLSALIVYPLGKRRSGLFSF